MTDILDEALPFLRCPQCCSPSVEGEDQLIRAGGSLRCGAGHCFDIARSGYVSLLPGGTAKNAGDSAAMVRARSEFLAAGHFAGLAAALTEAALTEAALTEAALTEAAAQPPAPPAGCVVEVGAGTGYYLAAVLDRLPDRIGLALDRSKSALQVAARSHARIAAIGCDAWRPLPVADNAAELVISLFAPRDGAELARILSPSGSLIVGTPTQDHLSELIGPLGLLSVDEHKQTRLADKLSPHFEPTATVEHRATLRLRHPAVTALATMGPGYWHTDPSALAARVAQLPDPVEVTLAVTLTTYRLAAIQPR
ncbi:MAG TPA: methyltransferase domain-containing protein [Streptosporangiaceae bacterium]|nr:methyltransferase domain-containing protein [Streptosporangiaceae bacterium]